MPRRPDLRSREAEQYRKLYWHKRWRGKHGRKQQQLTKQPLCERCLAKGLIVQATTAHHLIPHKGNEDLFWHGELQSVCAPCHDVDIQAEEARGYGKAVDETGWPVDPRHPVNRGASTHQRR